MRPNSRFRHATTRDLYIYWEQNRKGMKALSREDLEPNEIRHILPDVFILDADDIENATFRIAGSRVCAVTCRELQGQKFLKDWHGENRDKIMAAMEAICTSGAVSILSFHGISSSDQRQEFEMVMLPLRANGSNRINRILGAMVATDSPYWLGMRPLIARDIENVRVIWPTATVPSITGPRLGKESAIGLGASIWRSPRVLRTSGHLTLIEGGKA